MKDKTKGILCMIASALAFSLMQIAVKLTSDNVSIFLQVVFRNFLLSIFSIAMLKKHKEKLMPVKEHRVALFFRGFLGLFGAVMYFYSTKNLPTANAAILQKSSPFFVMIFAAIFLNEKLTKVHVASLLVAFLGAYFVTNPSGNYNLIPALSGIFSAIFAAGAYTIIGKLGKTENPYRIMLAFGAVTCVCLLVPLILTYKRPLPIDWLYLLLIGIFGGMGQYLLTVAYVYAPAGEVSIYNYTSVIFSAILGFIIFNDKIIPIEFLGIGLILLSAVILFLYNQKNLGRFKKNKKVKKM